MFFSLRFPKSRMMCQMTASRRLHVLIRRSSQPPPQSTYRIADLPCASDNNNVVFYTTAVRRKGRLPAPAVLPGGPRLLRMARPASIVPRQITTGHGAAVPREGDVADLRSGYPVPNHARVRRQILTSMSITGTSMRTPTTVASEAPLDSPNSIVEVAMATSK